MEGHLPDKSYNFTQRHTVTLSQFVYSLITWKLTSSTESRHQSMSASQETDRFPKLRSLIQLTSEKRKKILPIGGQALSFFKRIRYKPAMKNGLWIVSLSHLKISLEHYTKYCSVISKWMVTIATKVLASVSRFYSAAKVECAAHIPAKKVYWTIKLPRC